MTVSTKVLRTSGLADPGDYVIGRGKVYFASVDTNGYPLEYRDLGNCPDFKITVASTKVEHQSSRSGLKTTDKEIVVQQTVSFSFALDEINFDNLALFMSGTVATDRSQANTAVVGVNNVWLSGKGRWYDLFNVADLTAAYPPASDPFAKRIYNVNTGVTPTVKVHGAGSNLTVNTDYTFDFEQGRIFIPTTSSVTGTEKLDVSFTPVTSTVEEVRSLTRSSVQGALRFEQINPVDSETTIYQFHGVTLAADGDFSLIGDDFSKIGFTGKAEAREAISPNSPTLTINHVHT